MTKGHPVDKIRAVLDAGAEALGENYAEAALPKIEALVDRRPHWVMIGHIQSRKSSMVANHFDSVQSLDSVKLARRLHTAREGGRPLPALVQVNVSGEAAKFGLPAWERTQEAVLVETMRRFSGFSSLAINGLMTIPPFLSPDEVRPYFRKLAALRDRLQEALPDLSLHELSMGMSGDFEAAVEEGATCVRVGTAIMGPRR